MPAELRLLASEGDFRALSERYDGRRPGIHQTILRQLRGQGAKSAFVEYRYLDADYRSEHSRFYSTTFRRYPSIAQRVHFFTEELGEEYLDSAAPTHFADLGYLGYFVARPVPASPIGRTMVPPPPELAAHVTCIAKDKVNLFGSELEVAGAPFMSQDAQLGVCVHVAAWVAGYYHWRRFDGLRHLPSAISGFAPIDTSRSIPSPPTTVNQLAAILEAMDLPAVTYELGAGDHPGEVAAMACRYLNSGLPVIAAGGSHVFTLVGYRRVRRPLDDRESIQFIRHDDLRGPYQLVTDPAHDQHRPWKFLIIPLPRKLYVSAERAEQIGKDQILEALEQVARDAGSWQGLACRELLAKQAGTPQDLTFRSTAMLSNELKTHLARRGRPGPLVGLYQWMPMSRWIWVIEATLRTPRDAGQPCVVAEAIIDATDHTDDPRPIAWRVPGSLTAYGADTNEILTVELDEIGPLPVIGGGSTAVVEV